MSDGPEKSMARDRCRIAWTGLLKANWHIIVGADLDADETTILVRLRHPRDPHRRRSLELTFGSRNVTLTEADGGQRVQLDAADPESYRELARLLRKRYGLAYRP